MFHSRRSRLVHLTLVRDLVRCCCPQAQLVIGVKRARDAAPAQVDCDNTNISPANDDELAIRQSVRVESSEVGAASTSERVEVGPLSGA